MTLQVIFITSGTSFIIPSDCTVATIEVIGGGGSGFTSAPAGGGGGAAYAKVNALAVTPGATLNISIGGSAADTWANKTTNAAPSSTADGVLAKGGVTATSSTGAAGGAGGACVGDATFSGGNGGTGGSFHGGGGGAAGPLGAGGTGADGNASGGGGGGGNGGGSAGDAAAGTAGGAGGNNNGGTGGGAGGLNGSFPNGSPGTNGGGGGGTSGSAAGVGGAGGAGTEWTSTLGATAGSGGGGGADSSAGTPGGLGALYGGGGGARRGAAGAQGIIVFSYTPSIAGAASIETNRSIVLAIRRAAFTQTPRPMVAALLAPAPVAQPAPLPQTPLWPPAPLPPTLPRLLSPQLTAVEVDPPPPLGGMVVMWWIDDAPPQLARRLPAGLLSVDNPPFGEPDVWDLMPMVWSWQPATPVPVLPRSIVPITALAAQQPAILPTQPWLSAWIAPAPLPTLPRALPIVVTSVRVDQPVGIPNGYAAGVLTWWVPVVPAAILTKPLVAIPPAVVSSIPAAPVQPWWLSWIAPPPAPILGRFLPASITAVEVDNPPPLRRLDFRAPDAPPAPTLPTARVPLAPANNDVPGPGLQPIWFLIPSGRLPQQTRPSAALIPSVDNPPPFAVRQLVITLPLALPQRGPTGAPLLVGIVVPHGWPWLSAVLSAWAPGAPLPASLRPTVATIPPPRVDQPVPSSRAGLLAGILAAWQPPPPAPILPRRTPQPGVIARLIAGARIVAARNRVRIVVAPNRVRAIIMQIWGGGR